MLSLGTAADAWQAGIGARRQAFADLMRFSDKTVAIGAVETRILPGPEADIEARIYTPLGAAHGLLPGLVFFHGGGFVAGTLDTHDALCRMLANETGCRTISIDYRLAPEHKFPAAVTDAAFATQWVLAHAPQCGLDPARIGVGGDSAGAALAIVACGKAKEEQGLMPAFQLLLCPITDFVAETPSRRDFSKGYLIDAAMIDCDLAHYLPRADERSRAMVSPLRHADFRGFPPAFIHTAEFDPFRDEGHAYAGALQEAGVACAYTCHAGMLHLFYAMPAVIPYGRRAVPLIGAEIRAALQP